MDFLGKEFLIVEKVSTFAWLYSNASLFPAIVGLGVALIGLVFFVRPSRRGSIISAFLALIPAMMGMLMVYSIAKDFVEIAQGDSVVKPSAMAQCVGRGFGTALSSLFGTSLALYVSLLALLRSWKRNRILGAEVTHGAGGSMGSQGYQARVTRGLNAFEPPSQMNQQAVKDGIELDEMMAGAGVGFVPGSPIDAISRAKGDGGTNPVNDSPTEDDDDIIDVEEVEPS